MCKLAELIQIKQAERAAEKLTHEEASKVMAEDIIFAPNAVASYDMRSLCTPPPIVKGLRRLDFADKGGRNIECYEYITFILL
eukprot:6193919-Pleurochrysis_carterae.AAC.6